jgi:hypothetical protein
MAPLTVDAIVLAPSAIEGRIGWPLWRTPSWNQHNVIALHVKSPRYLSGFNISQTIRDWSSGCMDAGHSTACVTTLKILAAPPMLRRIADISRTTAHRLGIKTPTTGTGSCETAPTQSLFRVACALRIPSVVCPSMMRVWQ